MDMSGEQRIPAPREVVWQALNDPEILKVCIPGCQELVKRSDTQMSAKVVLKVGPVSARFEGAVTLSDLDPPESYRISGEGQGGMAGFAKGEALVRLEADGAETLLRYEVSAQVGGRLAQLGARLIDATAKQMSGAFFKRFAEEIVARRSQGADAVAAAPEASGAAGMARGGASRPVVPAPALAAPASGRAGAWGPGLIGLCLAAVSLVASAYILSGARGGEAGLSLEFGGAVILILTMTVGYLLGRLGPAAPPVIVIDRDRIVAQPPSGADGRG